MSKRDVFLSHRSDAKPKVREVAAAIESDAGGPQLTAWLDEAEIRPGQSIPGMVNEGLETSRFIALLMTPSYFHGGSGWTDAEWHAALHQDPDNRRGRILPLVLEDCPYIPFLLRHLNSIDLRGDNYARGIAALVAVLRGQPLPRPIAHRGQLVTAGRIDRASLVAERAVPDAAPDVIDETLSCNLLPVERLPKYIYSAPISRAIPARERTKNALRERIYDYQQEHGQEQRFMPAFRVENGKVHTFYDLTALDSPLAPLLDDDDPRDERDTVSLLADEDDRRLAISLLNMAVGRHAIRKGLVADHAQIHRFFFPPKDGRPREVDWLPYKKKARRTVAKPVISNDRVIFWRHHAAYLSMIHLANKLYLQISPTWVLTEQGTVVKSGPTVGKSVIRWTGAERNLHLLYHVRFWTATLTPKAGIIPMRAGSAAGHRSYAGIHPAVIRHRRRPEGPAGHPGPGGHAHRPRGRGSGRGRQRHGHGGAGTGDA